MPASVAGDWFPEHNSSLPHAKPSKHILALKNGEALPVLKQSKCHEGKSSFGPLGPMPVFAVVTKLFGNRFS